MADQDKLEAIRVKLADQITQKEKEIKELHSKLHSVDVALGLLFEQGDSRTDKKVIEIRKDRYAKMGLSDAIRDCINSYGATRVLSTGEIRKYLIDNGIQTKAKHFYSTVFATLKRLADKGEIGRVKGKGFKKTESSEIQQATL